jgi:hypothetical protein
MPEQATAVIAPVTTQRPHRVKRRFYISAGLFMILFSVVAFGPSSTSLTGTCPFHSRRWGRLTPSWLRRFSSSILSSQPIERLRLNRRLRAASPVMATPESNRTSVLGSGTGISVDPTPERVMTAARSGRSGE